jgi:NNP family nitrate/nitrite transporter-like MFS transporter
VPSSCVSSSLPLLLLALVFYLNFIARIIAAPLLPELETSLNISHGQAGSFFLCISSGYFFSLLGSGFLSARLGHKRTIILSLVLLSLSLCLVALSPGLQPLRGSFLLLGLAAGLYLPSGVATITDLYPPRILGRAFGVHEISPNLAFLTAPLLAAWLLPLMAWRNIFFTLALTAAAAALLYGLLGRSAHLRGTPPALGTCLELLALPRFWLMVVLFSMGITSTHGVYSMLPTFLVDVHSMDERSANLLVGLSRSTTLVTAFLGGWLADRFGAGRTIGAVLLLTGGLTILLGTGSGSALTLWIWLQPLAAVCFFAPAFSVLARLGSGDDRAVVISLAIPLAFVIGGGVVPALISRMADSGHFSLGFVLTGMFIASGVLLIILLRHAQRS